MIGSWITLGRETIHCRYPTKLYLQSCSLARSSGQSSIWAKATTSDCARLSARDLSARMLRQDSRPDSLSHLSIAHITSSSSSSCSTLPSKDSSPQNWDRATRLNRVSLDSFAKETTSGSLHCVPTIINRGVRPQTTGQMRLLDEQDQ